MTQNAARGVHGQAVELNAQRSPTSQPADDATVNLVTLPAGEGSAR
jgi:hypothetical protein